MIDPVAQLIDQVCCAILDSDGQKVYADVLRMVKLAKAANKAFYFIGNGGSAAIASHMAADWMKNGGMRAMAFNDGAALTCLSNDLGYERVFSVPLQRFANQGDVLFAVSSSGQSQNILEAASLGERLLLNVVTLSGFRPDNLLRRLGKHNFYVPSMKYGVVEIAHLAILHSLLDEVMTDAAPS